MLRIIPVPDVRKLHEWQLDAAWGIWRDFQDKIFEPFHRCAVDAERIELDRRMMNDMIGLDRGGARGYGAAAACARQ